MARQRHGKDFFSLAGWLFADLFIVIAIIFITSSTIAAPIQKGQVQPTPTPTPTPTPRTITSLNTESVKLIAIVDVIQLQNGDDAAKAEVERQVREQLQQKNLTQQVAGLVLTFGCSGDINEGILIARAANTVLRSMGEVFQKAVFRDYMDNGCKGENIHFELFLFSYT